MDIMPPMIFDERGSYHEQPDGSEVSIHEGYRITRDASVRDQRELGYRAAINPERFVAACQRVGLSPDEVSLRVMRSSPPSRRGLGAYFGQYIPMTGEVRIFTDPHADLYLKRTGRDLSTFRSPSDLRELDTDVLEYGVNVRVQKTIYHELRHAKVFSSGRPWLHKLYDSIPFLTSSFRYRTHPEEKDANRAAANSPVQPQDGQIVAIHPRSF